MIAINATVKKRAATTFSALLIIFISFIITFPGAVAQIITDSIVMFAQKLLPSLLPMAVVTGIFTKMGYIPFVPVKLLSKLLRFDKKCTTAMILGLFAGFPVGAVAIGDLYHRGEITKENAENALCFCLNPGAVYLISGVGYTMFGSIKVGILLYAAQTITILLIAFFTVKSRTVTHIDDDISESTVSFSDICSSISSSAYAMINVCAFITIFSLLGEIINSVLQSLSSVGFIKEIVFVILEISNALKIASSHGGIGGILLASMACGWCGLCVHMQVGSACAGLSLKKYMLTRLIMSGLCPIITCLLIVIFQLK